MQQVTIVQQHPVRGGIIVVEALIFGIVVGGVLYSKNINPVGDILAGAAASSFYGYLFTRKPIALVMSTIASLGWALIAAMITRGLWHTGNRYDWVWGTVAGAVGFYMSWKLHTSGAAELREAAGRDR